MLTTLVIVIAALTALVLLVSFVYRWRTGRARELAAHAANEQDHRTTANERRREAGALSAKASELNAEAKKLDDKAEEEIKLARVEEELAGRAGRRARRRFVFSQRRKAAS